MQYQAISKNVRHSPRKVRDIAAVVKKLSPAQALEKLSFLVRGGSESVAKTLQSAIANSKLTADKLRIKNIFVDEGIKMKRRDKHHRISRDSGLIQKRASHITVILESYGQ